MSQEARSSEGQAGIIFASATLPSSGDGARSSIIDVRGVRKLALFVDYDPAGAGGYPHILPLVSNTDGNGKAAPLAGDDVWFAPTHNDGVVTDVTPDTGLPSGADYSAPPPWGEVTQKALLIRLPAAVNAADEYRYAIVLDVTPFRWFHFVAFEKGATGSPGTLLVKYAPAN